MDVNERDSNICILDYYAAHMLGKRWASEFVMSEVHNPSRMEPWGLGDHMQAVAWQTPKYDSTFRWCSSWRSESDKDRKGEQLG